MSKCLVLGATGFIGAHLVDELLQAGHEVRAFDRTKREGAQTSIEERPNLTIFRGDFLNRNDLDAALEGIEYVFHFISTTTPATSAKSPLLDIDTNLKMSVELMGLCVKHKVKRLIFPSTGGAIYGQSLSRPITEQDLTEPVSPYAIGKLAIEGYLRYFRQTHDLDYLTLRVSNPYGIGQNLTGNQGVIPIFLNLIQQNRPIIVFGDGNGMRDYIYITDLVGMIMKVFNKPTKYQTYNLGAGTGLTLGRMIGYMEEITGKKAEVRYQPKRPTDIESVVLDINRYREEFGEPDLTSLKDGIAKTWDYVLSKAEESK